MLLTVKKTAITAITALSLAAAGVAPANALGRSERNFLGGVAAALLVTTIINQSRTNAAPRTAAPQYTNAPRYDATPQYRAVPQYRAPQTVQPRPVYGRVIGRDDIGSSIYQTPAAQAFNAYRPSERQAIQRNLAAQGYYRSSIDGAFGPGTYGAVAAYARDTGASDRLGSREGAFGIYDALIY